MGGGGVHPPNNRKFPVTVSKKDKIFKNFILIFEKFFYIPPIFGPSRGPWFRMSKISNFRGENTLPSLNNLMFHYDNFTTFLKISIFWYLSSLITVAPSPSWLNWTITTIPPWNIAFFLTGSIAIVIDRMIRKHLHAYTYIYIYIYWVPSPHLKGETVTQQSEKMKFISFHRQLQHVHPPFHEVDEQERKKTKRSFHARTWISCLWHAKWMCVKQ